MKVSEFSHDILRNRKKSSFHPGNCKSFDAKYIKKKRHMYWYINGEIKNEVWRKAESIEPKSEKNRKGALEKFQK